jgi:hypothetical protein
MENWLASRAMRITALPSGEATMAGPGAATTASGANMHTVAAIGESRFILVPFFFAHRQVGAAVISAAMLAPGFRRESRQRVVAQNFCHAGDFHAPARHGRAAFHRDRADVGGEHRCQTMRRPSISVSAFLTRQSAISPDASFYCHRNE